MPRVPASFSLSAQRPDDQILKRADAHLYSILQQPVSLVLTVESGMLVVELVIHDTIGLAVPDREVHLVDADSPNAAVSASRQAFPSRQRNWPAPTTLHSWASKNHAGAALLNAKYQIVVIVVWPGRTRAWSRARELADRAHP